MNKPNPDLRPPDLDPDPDVDHDLGPLDEHGQQIWSPEEEAAIARLRADPYEWAAIEEGLADIAAGRMISSEELELHSVERRRLWLAERGS